MQVCGTECPCAGRRCRMEMREARRRARRELEVTRGNLERAERRKAPERDLEALRSKVDFWETVCAEIGAGSDVEE